MSTENLNDNLEVLRLRLEEAEETLRAIRSGEVDALVVNSSDGEQVFTLQGADHPYRLMVENMREGAVTVNTDDTILYCNVSFAEMIGWPHERIVGATFSEFVDESERATFEGFLKGATNRGCQTETRMRKQDQSSIPVLVAVGVLEENNTMCFVVTDLTEHKKNDELLASQKVERALNAQAQKLLVREERLRAEAERANGLKDEFLATVSHELRTPLNAVVGWSTLLRTRKCDEATLVRGIEAIERNARAQAQLIEDLLDVSRITSGKLRLNVSPMDLTATIEAAVESIRPAADAKGINLSVSLDQAVSAIEGDASRLQQVVSNLLSNAVKFTPAGGSAQLSLEKLNSHVRITVQDTGEGISEDFLPYVFDRFQQANGTYTRRHGGLGLGLAITRHLVEMHGGTIEAHSRGLGAGATFVVTIPTQAETTQLLVDDSNEPFAAEQEDAPPNLHGLRILTIDDEAGTRDMVRATLETWGARVMTARSVREGLNAFDAWKPDVLICDIGMPDEDGYSFISKVRSADGGAHVPAIALTGYVRKEERTRALESGYQMFLPKPVEAMRLASVVASVSGRTNGDGK